MRILGYRKKFRGTQKSAGAREAVMMQPGELMKKLC